MRPGPTVPVAEIVAVAGARLWTESRGRGVPLVLAHGGPGLSSNLGPVAELAAPGAARERFLHLLWSTDFATRGAAETALARGPLYAFPRAEAVARAVQADWEARLVRDARGEHDPDPDGAREVAELAPRGQWAPIAGAGHTPWLERPDAVRERLRAYLGAAVSRGDSLRKHRGPARESRAGP